MVHTWLRQAAGGMQFGPVVGLHAAPSAAAAWHVPWVDPPGVRQVPLASHTVTDPVADRPHAAPIGAMVASTHALSRLHVSETIKSHASSFTFGLHVPPTPSRATHMPLGEQ